MQTWVGLLLVVTGCGGTSSVDIPSREGGADGQSASDGGVTGADGQSASDGGVTAEGGVVPSDGAADAAVCADLQAKMDDALVKTCTSADECAVVTVYNCCAVYTGIRKDKLADFQAAQQAYTTACPDLRGCGCQDHTETGELVPAVQPPPVVVATCDGTKCTAHVQK